MVDSFYDECPYCELDSKGNHKYGCPYNPSFYDELVKYLDRRRKSKMNIREFTKEELENELKRREEEERIKDIPKRKDSYDINTILNDFEEGLLKLYQEDFDDLEWKGFRLQILHDIICEIYDPQHIESFIDERGYEF